MSKRKSIIILTILVVLIIAVALITVPMNGEDSFKIGGSIYDFKWIAKTIKLGLDLDGGMYAIYEADLNGIESPDSAMKGAMSNLESLLFSKGYTEAIVTRQGNDQIRIEVPSVDDTEALMALIGKPAKLEFRDESGNVLVEGNKHLKDAYATTNNGQNVIKLEFNDLGREAFSKATSDNVGKKLVIYIDDQKIMEPTVNAAINDGNAIIEGDYSFDEADQMAVKIKSGALEVPLSMIQAETISESLGEGALTYGLIAGLVGIIFIFIFLILIYKAFGVCASIALIIYTELLIIALAIVPWVQLTLPGIAGIILSIGMAVDANVIIFERIKDESRNGKRLNSAVKAGFKKAVVAIIDANITTIIGAVIMMIFGATAIKSFAVTLFIGILLSMFTSIVVSRLLVKMSLSFNDTNEKLYGLNFKKEASNEKA